MTIGRHCLVQKLQDWPFLQTQRLYAQASPLALGVHGEWLRPAGAGAHRGEPALICFPRVKTTKHPRTQ
jgi:hypothetical protein